MKNKGIFRRVEISHDKLETGMVVSISDYPTGPSTFVIGEIGDYVELKNHGLLIDMVKLNDSIYKMYLFFIEPQIKTIVDKFLINEEQFNKIIKFNIQDGSEVEYDLEPISGLAFIEDLESYFLIPSNMKRLGFDLVENSSDGYYKYQNNGTIHYNKDYDSKYAETPGKVLINVNLNYSKDSFFIGIRQDGGTRTVYNGVCNTQEFLVSLLYFIR